MKHSGRILLAALLIMSITPLSQIFAQTTPEDPTLTDTQTAIDQEVANLPQQQRTTQWAERYQIEEQVVTDLRNQGRGWGEISTELTLAEHLTTSDPDTFPTMQDALNQIDTLRNDGAGWGQIAKQYDVKLGKLVSAGKRDVHAIQSDELGNRQSGKESAMTLKSEKMPKPTKTRMNKSSRPHKIDRPARPERPTRPDRPQRPERPSRPHKPERPGR